MTSTEIGIPDALVFRRLTQTNWVHLGGLGRGKGWAGLVDVGEADGGVLADLPRPGQVARYHHSRSERVVGPYYAVGAAVARVSGDVFVVFGDPAGPLPADASDDDLMALARELDAGVGTDISPSKKLADELEVLHAVRAVATLVGDDLSDTMQRVVSVALEALSCEIGAVRNRHGQIVAWVAPADLGQAPTDASDDAAGSNRTALPDFDAAMDILAARAGGGSYCRQDVAEDPELSGLRAWGIRSVMAVTIPPPVGGLLAVAHTDAGPRGFTTLCQQLGRHVAETAGVVAHTAALRDELRVVAQEHARLARLDVLTGLGNRLAWEEALDEATDMVEHGRHVTVVSLDVNGLKTVNDTLGHDAGDRLLRDCASLIREWCRPLDVCVRLGGDEFGIFVPAAGEEVRHRVADLVDRLCAPASTSARVAASVGSAEAGGDVRVADAVRQADMAMYAAKRGSRP